MEVRSKIDFTDLKAGKFRTKGEKFTLSEERYEELKKRDFVYILEEKEKKIVRKTKEYKTIIRTKEEDNFNNKQTKL